MFRAIILPILRSARLCVTVCGITHTRCCRPATSWVHYTTSCNTQSSAPEDGQNNCPKHVELTGIINKPLLLHLVGCLYYLYQCCTVKHSFETEVDYLFKNRVACFTGKFIAKYHNTWRHTAGESSITFALGTSDCTISYRNVRRLDKVMAGPSDRSPAETVGSNPTDGMDVCRDCCVLSNRGLCDVLITRPEESYRLRCVVVCDLEISL